MELWIRSQDRRHLIKVDKINWFGGEIYTNDSVNLETTKDGEIYLLGKYSNGKRALEVLDEIQNKIHQTFICDIKPLVNRSDCERLKLDLEYEYPNNEFIMQPQQYELKPINSNVVIYEMPKE